MHIKSCLISALWINKEYDIPAYCDSSNKTIFLENIICFQKCDLISSNMYSPIVVGSEELREEDLSHPVHSDNCMIQDDGSCIADDLAYSQRHYRYDTPPPCSHTFILVGYRCPG